MIDPAIAFAARCEARALLVEGGVLELPNAVDVLQQAAVAYGLVEELGQDIVQAIMGAAFKPAALPPPSQEDARAGNARSRRAAHSTVDALLFSLRSGVGALGKPDTLRRLLELSDAQLRAVAVRLQKFQPHIATAWTADDIAVLITVRSKAHA
jgi:hypothetical protein